MIANQPALSSTLRDSVSVSLRHQAEAIKQSWLRGGTPDALDALRQLPQLGSDPVLCLDLAYEEYCIRKDAGEDPDVDAFCSRFPLCRSSLKRLIGAHGYFSANPGMITKLPAISVWPAPGERLGDFTVVRELGRGAFARAFLATEASTGDRPVVLKLTPEDLKSKEARTLGRLAHPSIVPVLSAHAQIDGMTVLCMPFQGTVTLETVLDSFFSPASNGAPPSRASAILDVLDGARHPDDPELELPAPPTWLRQGSYSEAVLHLAEQLAEALDFLHRHQVSHRDLKPSNLLLRPDGRVLLLDFNLSADARLVTPHTGGTVPYMAPEQIQVLLDHDDAEPLDERADLFSFGVILYELLTGRHPFGPVPAKVAAREAGPMLLERQRQGCPPLRSLCPQLPRAVAQLLERCLAFDRRRRPASAAVVLAELRRHLRLRQKRRSRSLLAAGCLALLGMTLVGATLTPHTPPQPPEKTVEKNVAAHFQAGLNAFQEGNYRTAEAALTRALDADPLHADALFLLGRTQLALNNYLLAKQHFDQALNVDRARSFPSVVAMAGSPGPGRCLLTTGTLLEREKECGPTLAYLGYCSGKLGNHLEADLRARQALACGFSTAAVYNNWAYSLLQSRDFEGAQRNLDEALRLDPNLQAAHLGCVYKAAYLRIGGLIPSLPRETFGHLEKALAGKNKDPEVYLYAARVHALAARDYPAEKTAHLGQAISFLQEAIRRGTPASAVTDVTFVHLVAHPQYAVLANTPQGTVPAVRPCPFLADPLTAQEK